MNVDLIQSVALLFIAVALILHMLRSHRHD